MHFQIFAEFIDSGNFTSVFLRDVYVAFRMFVFTITIYHSLKVANRVKDAGFSSTITGMSLYLLGNGLYQASLSFLMLYEITDSLFRFYYFASTFYLGTMGLYTIFYEMEIKRYFPNRADVQKRILSILAIVIFIGAIILSIIYVYYMFFGTCSREIG